MGEMAQYQSPAQLNSGWYQEGIEMAFGALALLYLGHFPVDRKAQKNNVQRSMLNDKLIL